MEKIGNDGGYAVPLGFGMAVSMWAVAYVCRLPAVLAPPWLVLAVLLTAVVWWGSSAGRWTGDGWGAGARVGLVAAILNMLILGSLLTSSASGAVTPSALFWIPGSMLAIAGLAATSSAIGSRQLGAGGGRNWTGLFAKVAVVATFLLVVAGGLVTSNEAGLAVVDWPNTFGYNMFLYPLARMTGGVYYEHAHRLFGALVGLTTVVLAVLLQRCDDRGWVRRLGWAAVAMVVVQGILGGLRVTGRFTLDDVRLEPNITLAVVHGALAQVFLGTVVALAVFSSRRWRSGEAVERRTVRLDRILYATLVGLLVAQIVLGAVQRHLDRGLTVHIVMAAVVALVAVPCGARAWILNPNEPRLRFYGHAVTDGTIVQILLGLAAYVATRSMESSRLEVGLATLHQWFSAALLACAVALALWTWRFSRS